MKKKKNTLVVTLPDGDTITVRKVSQKTLGLLSANMLMQSSNLMKVARQHSKDAAEALQGVSEIPSRPPSASADKLMESVVIEATQQLKRGAIRYGLVEPKFSELLEAYDGSEDLPDYGLGDDFDFISDSIIRFSEGGEAAAEQVALTFPGHPRNTAGWDGRTVPPPAEPAAGIDP